VSRRRPRVQLPADGGVRAAYAAHLRERWEGRAGWTHFSRIVTQLEAGEPVVVAWWEVRRWAPRLRHPMFGGTDRVRIEPNGTVTPVVALRVGADIVDWEPA
jgi:hypothetical protein